VKIYLDACALNRLTDDQKQPRIHAEAEAVEHIFYLIWQQRIEWSASTILAAELRKNPDAGKRHDAMALLAFAPRLTSPTPQTITRAMQLEAAGYGPFDAFHLACAEADSVDALVTTDDRFMRQAARNLGNPVVSVVNPVDLLKEVRAWLPK